MTDLKPNQNNKVAFTVIDGEATLVAPDTSLMYWLNPVATRIWELSDGSHSKNAIVEAICDEFEVDSNTASEDLNKMLSAFEEKQLISSNGADN